MLTSAPAALGGIVAGRYSLSMATFGFKKLTQVS
jgi:hypothetical protein